MTSSALIPATSAAVPRPLVAGIDLLTTRERDADALAHALAAVLVDGGATAVTVATHWARTGQVRHVALSVEATEIDSGVAWPILFDALRPRADDSVAILLGGRYLGPARLRDAVDAAVDAQLTRSSGRAVVFPGSAELPGTVSVAQVLATTAIDRLRVLAADDADPDAVLVTRGHVRPRWVNGELLLDVQPAVGGTLVPFETPNPTPCCADHA
jgi:hypothetical protein